MKISLSGIAARYYVADGWTRDVLEKYLVSGAFVLIRESVEDTGYFTLGVGGAIDVKKLLADHKDLELIKLYVCWNAQIPKSYKQKALERCNWDSQNGGGRETD